MPSQPRLHGEDPRPRVVVLGKGWSADELADLRKVFPTVHEFEGQDLVDIDWSEVDLVITEVPFIQERGVHLISFATDVRFRLDKHDYAAISTAMSKGFRSLDTPPRLAQHVKIVAAGLDDARGLPVLSEIYENDIGELDAHYPACPRGTLLAANKPDAAFALAALGSYRGAKEGIAWIPTRKDRVGWVRALRDEWAEHLPGVANWSAHPDWMTVGQRRAKDELDAFVAKRAEVERDLARTHANFEGAFAAETYEAERGPQMILLAAGADLTDRVAEVLRIFGFEAQYADKERIPGEALQEDLRLTVPGDPTWLALVEVRAYSRASVKQKDIARLAKFADAWRSETGFDPTKLIYIVNGQHELPPSQRHSPFQSDENFRRKLEQDGNLVIATTDLFRMHRDLPPDEARRLIVESKGVLLFPPQTTKPPRSPKAGEGEE